MPLAEELKSLQDLHDRGKLTDTELASAKAVVLNNEYHEARHSAKSNSAGLKRIALAVVAVGVFLFALNQYNTNSTRQRMAAAFRSPVQLASEVQNLPANSWKGMPLNLPYAGNLAINLSIVRGNPLDVMLVNADQLPLLNANDWRNVRAYPDFNAQQTKVYVRSAQLPQGSYYLVLRDPSLGIFSVSATDVSVRVQLNP